MDQALNREEKDTLCELLGIPRKCYGNYPLMKSSFRQACLKFHPDKGGDEALMQRLNSLWQRFQQAVYQLRRDLASSFEEDSDEEPPIYGTPQFKAWWRRQTGSPSSRFSRDGASASSTQSSGYNSCPRGRRGPSRDDLPSSHPKHPQGNLFGGAARVPEWDDEFLRCDENLSPEPPSTEEDPSNSDFSETSSQRTSSSRGRNTEEGQYASTASPRRKRPYGTPPRRGGSPTRFSMPCGTPPFGRREPQSSPTQSYSSTPPRPKKNKTVPDPTDFPADLRDFLSHAVYSNKTMNAFAVFTTPEKGKVLYHHFDSKFRADYKGLFSFNDGYIMFALTLKKHRVTAVKNFLVTFCTVSFLVVKGVNKPSELYSALSHEPYSLIEETKPLFPCDFSEKEKPPCVDWNVIAEFACEYHLDDPLIILAHYLDFAKPFIGCPKCEKPSLKAHTAHPDHHANARLFLECRVQKSICQQAAEVYMAKKRLQALEMTREEILCHLFKTRMEKLRDFDSSDMKVYLAGVAWYKCMFQDFEDKVYHILGLLTENVPKSRNVMFKGPINSGKTSLAAALLDLLEGKALNVNCPADKLPFELGCAMDKFMVCFEDVKGQAGNNKELQPGQGFHNLDNLRDHLDGAVPVSLEKKHINKRHQLFPPAIITCNDYIIPKTVHARVAYTLNFQVKDNLRKALDKNYELRKRRILQSGTTILLCLIFCLELRQFKQCLHEEIKKWRDIIEAEVGHSLFCKMIENIEVGEDPLNGVFEYE
ncbi:large tumor antigen [Eptesicus serotinus polyomavirus 1]|uniref:Large T antigen n=1 Tax=Eptesicus serotinus polyomavirus 1 TaxID=2990647 RepID=A0AAE9P7J4_9POLY|nr:large tumor antigen [Eptesicus serotinus polyomavirus 1]